MLIIGLVFQIFIILYIFIWGPKYDFDLMIRKHGFFMIQIIELRIIEDSVNRVWTVSTMQFQGDLIVILQFSRKRDGHVSAV